MYVVKSRIVQMSIIKCIINCVGDREENNDIDSYRQRYSQRQCLREIHCQIKRYNDRERETDRERERQ